MKRNILQLQQKFLKIWLAIYLDGRSSGMML